MTLHQKPRRTGTAVATALLAGSILAGLPAYGTAQAAHAHPPKPYGTVIAHSGLNERQYPSTDSKIKGALAYRERVALRCKVRAQNIRGNDVWYLLRHRDTWVTARYVVNTGFVPYCIDVMSKKHLEHKMKHWR